MKTFTKKAFSIILIFLLISKCLGEENGAGQFAPLIKNLREMTAVIKGYYKKHPLPKSKKEKGAVLSGLIDINVITKIASMKASKKERDYFIKNQERFKAETIKDFIDFQSDLILSDPATGAQDVMAITMMDHTIHLLNKLISELPKLARPDKK